MKILTKKPAHVALLILGAAFLLIDAFHGNIWFDESYSVGIAKYSFVDIWNIGSGDVHPVLFYWCLHVIYLLIGENWLAYRLFAVAGAVALGALGLTHIRRDFGAKVGVVFTFLALFTPYVSQMSSEIRMYTWVSFTVMVCAIYGYRIVAVLNKTVPERIAAHLKTKRHTWAGVPVHWWIIFGVSSLASAYLQYYGALFVFMVNLLLLIFLITKRNKRAIIVFAVLAVLQVGLYVPWLVVAFSGQVGQVSGTYWARLTFPTTFIEIATYPLLTSQLSFAMRGDHGEVLQVLTNTAFVLFCVFAVGMIVAWVKRVKQNTAETPANPKPPKKTRGRFGKFFHKIFGPVRKVFRRVGARLKPWARRDNTAPFVGAFIVYLGVLLIATAVSIFLQTDILYYRYLYVGIGPFLFSIAGIITVIKPRWISCALCTSVVLAAVVNMTCLVQDNYSDENQAPLRAFEEASKDVDLILSSDIGFMGITALAYPDIPQTYMDWQKGRWNTAYKAYAPAMSSVKTWERALHNYHGKFLVIAQSQKGDVPRAVTDLDRKDNISVIDQQIYYRPYERTFFTIALLEKE